MVEHGDVVGLSQPSNSLTGSLQADWHRMKALSFIDLQENLLSCTIPLELARIASLEELYLNGNRLTGLMDLEFSIMPGIRKMHLHNNELRSIPDFSFGAGETGIDPSSIELKAEHNKLAFFYIENNLDSEGSEILESFTFYPQKKYGEPAIKGYLTGHEMRLEIKMLGANHYQWQHSTDGGSTWTDIGVDSPEYTVTGVSQNEAGHYKCVITNELVDLHTGGTNNEIESETIEVKIDEGPDSQLVNRPLD